MSAQRDKLILVRMALSQWGVRKFDKKASDEVAQANGAADSREVGRFNKILVDPEVIRPVRQAFAELRNRHYHFTAPWADDGVRVLPSALYFEYTQKIREGRGDCERAVKRFVDVDYEAERAAAPKRLGGLFRAADYPEAGNIAARFGIDVRFEPLPNPEDVRVWGIGDLAAQQVQKEVEQNLRRTIDRAHGSVVEQLRTRASEFVEKVRKFDGEETRQLRATALENLRGMVQVVLAGLNVTGDASLTALARELDAAIADTSADQLRENHGLRIAKTAEVDAITKRFAGAFGPARAAGVAS